MFRNEEMFPNEETPKPRDLTVNDASSALRAKCSNYGQQGEARATA